MTPTPCQLPIDSTKFNIIKDLLKQAKHFPVKFIES